MKRARNHDKDIVLPKELTFEEVISRRTAYGLIWGGHYGSHRCVTKMIMLTTGFHYDKPLKEYRTPKGEKMEEKYAEKYFGFNEVSPFLHTDFKHRRSMTPEAFFKELDELIGMGVRGLAPQVYCYGINRQHPIHYAFIIMERVDCSLKDIYLKRELHSKEHTLIKDLIHQLHETHGLLHGDLKPSNIGVYLDHHGFIEKACFFDCQKIKHREDCTPEAFAKYAQREGENYKKHIIKNKKEGKQTEQ